MNVNGFNKNLWIKLGCSFISIFCVAGYGHGRSLIKGACLEHFHAALSGDKSYTTLIGMAKRLTSKDLKCLYRRSADRGPPDMSFFLPSEGREKAVVIFGKNSAPIFNRFEKHVFHLDDGSVYGYNFHRAMRWTGPGFFGVSLKNGSILIDFSLDFDQEISLSSLAKVDGIIVHRIKSNHRNLFFGGNTKDYCHSLLYDDAKKRDLAIICQGHRTFFGITRKPFIWDILIRKW